MRLFLLTLFTAFPLFLTAQSYLGLVVGTELSSFTVGGDGQELFYSHPRPGLLLGFTGGMPLKERLILHLEVNFATAKTELRRGFISPGGSSSRTGIYGLNNAALALVPSFYLGKESRIFVGLGGFVSQLLDDPEVELTFSGSFVGDPGSRPDVVRTKLRSEELTSLAYGLQLRGGYRYPLSERFSLSATLNVRTAINDVRQPYTFDGPLRPLRIGLLLGAWRTF